MRFIPSLGRFPSVAFETVPSVRLTDDGPLSSFQGRLSSASSFRVGPSLSEFSGVVPSCFMLSLSTVFTEVSLIKREDSFDPLFKAVLYSLFLSGTM